jgi:dATP pyrophosphohydrolase
MARSPLQVNIVLFRRTSNGSYEFAVFHRTDGSMWHFVSGGVEEGESPQEAALRELFEEAGISPSGKLTPLESRASIPRDAYPHITHWPKEVLILQQYSYAANPLSFKIKLSDEHDEVRWLSYELAAQLLKWDSDKVALWELHEKLKTGRIA